jgi:predicted exporter
MRFRIALAAVLALLTVFAIWVMPRMRVETNLLALLPSTAENRVQLDAVKKFAERSSRELVFVVGTASRDRLRDTGAAFADSLRASGAFARVDYVVDDRYIAAARGDRGLRSALLASRDRERLVHGDVAALERDALRAAYTPLGFTRPFGISEDPLGLASAAFVEELPGAGRARLEGDILVVKDESHAWTVVRAATAGDPYRTETHHEVISAIDAARAAAARIAPDVDTAGSGVILHAAAAASKGQNEVAIFGGFDLAAVILLIMLVFRQVRPLIVTLLTIGIATCAAIAMCHFVFGEVHILTLTFGTSLIGVSVDYAMHYFVNRMPSDDGAHPHDIVPALILGCTTTVAGYLTFLIAPIPGLRQIALFSATGLATACAVVILLYPRSLELLSFALRKLRLERAAMPRAVPRWVARLAQKRLESSLPRAAIWMLGLGVTALGAAGLARLETRDDVRALQRPPPALVAAEQKVRTLLGVGFDPRFVLVTAPTPEDVLHRLEALDPVLRGLVEAKHIKGTLNVSPSLVSIERQRADRALLAREVYAPGGALERVMGRLGFDADAVAARRAEFAAAEGKFLTPEHWLESPLSAPVRHLWLGALKDGEGGDHAAVVMLDGNVAPDEVRKAVESVPGVAYVDQVADISQVLGEYRRIASWLMLVVVAVMLACLLVFYRSGAAVRTAIPAAAGLALTLATLGWMHEPVNLFHVLSLLLVLGLGVDYAIILREGRNQQAVLAVFLSMTTTLISFGLLGFSSVPFVRSIGITVAFGVAFTFLIALAARPRTH